MTLLVEKLKCQSHRSSTRQNYHGIWKNFNEFIIRLDDKPESWEERLTLFVGYLISKGMKANSVKSYISAIKCVLREDGVELNADRYVLNALTKACKYQNPTSVKIRLPIQKPLLKQLLLTTNEHFLGEGQVYLAHLYRALFSTAYFGLFRIGELTTGSHPIKAVDVQIAQNKKKVLFILRSSKTHWFDDKPQIVKISNTPINEIDQKKLKCTRSVSPMPCPFELLRSYLASRPTCTSLDEPFFVFRDRTPVTPSQMRSTLKAMLQKAGFDREIYSGHSFRSGRSLDLLKLKVPVLEIQKLGRWRSNCVFSYLTYI